MIWNKLGLIFRPDTTRWWSRSHAALPTPVRLSEGVIRVFYSSRDDRQRSHVGWFDLDLDRPGQVVKSSAEPVLCPGGIGEFDGDGIYAASAVLMEDGRLRLYCIGWNAGNPPPLFYAAIGMAESEDFGLSFCSRQRSPILARSDADPCLVTSPVVLREGNEWRMWYVSGMAWSRSATGSLQSHYHVKHARSKDGADWVRDNRSCMRANEPEETNISRFWVVHEEGQYHAFFGYHRGSGYRIGYGRSIDGLTWERDDAGAGISCSDGGWDAEAISYPSVIRHRDQWFMLYNGNGFGRDGVGLAVADALG